MTNPLITYLHQTTQPYALPTAIAPVLAVIQRPRFAAIRLPDKIRYHDGVMTVRTQWSHAIYEFVSRDEDWILLRNMHGNLGRRREDVLFEDEMVVDYKVVVLDTNEVKKAS